MGLDQFPLNLYRDGPQAIAAHAKPRDRALQVLERGWHRQTTPVERLFLFLPFEHSEELADVHDHALARHCLIGRLPHRNAVLGQVGAEEEIAFLAPPGSRF